MSALDPSAPGLPLAGGGGGGAPSGPAGGDLGGTYPDPTVTDLTIASEARGDLLRRGASAWERVAAKTSGNLVGGDGTDVVSLTPAVAAPPLAFANGHTQPDADTRFLWYCNDATSTVTNYGTVSGADLTVGATATQGALLLASLNGRGLLTDGTTTSTASGGVNKTPGVNDGLTWWAIFTVITPPTARRATIMTRNANAAFTAPYNSIAIVIDSATAGAPRSIVVEIGRVAGGYLEHITSVPYVSGVQINVATTLSGSTWKVYINGVLTNTYSDGSAIDWGDGTGFWQIASNAANETSIVHVTEVGVVARAWTADEVVQAEQRRLGRWRG